MKNLLKNTYFIIVKIIFDNIYGKLLVANKSFYENNVKTINIRLKSKTLKKYKIFKVNKSRIYSDLSQNVAVIKEKFILKNLSKQIIGNYLVDIKKNKILNTGTRKLIQKKIKGSMLSLVQGVSGIDNYGHWILDIMPKVFFASKYQSLSKYDAIYLPNINKHFQRQSLKYLNINRKKFIDGSIIRHVEADEIIIPQHPYWKINKHQLKTVENVDKNVILWLRKIFLKNKKKNNVKKRFIIDRSDSTFEHNQIQNKPDFYKHLKDLKFEIIQLSKLSFDKQINYFYNASCIISPHGAGLVNIIFCNPHTKIIELNNNSFKCRVFKNISKINKLNYMNLKTKKNIYNVPGDINVPVKKLLSFIS